MTLKVLALIVVYGADALATSSLKSLLDCDCASGSLRILVWDNSPNPCTDRIALAALNAEYFSTPENLGLSTIYNRVIRHHLEAGEHLLLLDQDTRLPASFLLGCAGYVRDFADVDLFLPMIRANERWTSPLFYIAGWGRYWRTPQQGLIPSRRVCAINSGMLISAAYLQGDCPGYDERLRFYGTDTQFMLDYADRRRWLVVSNQQLDHDLSFFSSPENRATKFSAMRNAYRFIYERRPWLSRLAVKCVMALVALRYALRYRDWNFLK